jgi:hypothetical protein
MAAECRATDRLIELTVKALARIGIRLTPLQEACTFHDVRHACDRALRKERQNGFAQAELEFRRDDE